MADNNTICISYMKIFCAMFLAICMFVSLSLVSFIFYEDEINGFLARHAIFDKYVAYINNKNDLEARLDKIASNTIRLFVENEFVKKSNELFDEAKNKINQAIEIRNKNTLSSTTNNNMIDMDKSSKSLALAREQRSKANFDLASLYYTNAIYANSNDMTAMIEYVSMFKDAAINSKNDVNTATQYIELAITSLKNFTITSTSENIQVVYNLIKELTLLRNDLYEHANTDVGSNSELPQICVNTDVNSVVSNNATTLEQKIYELDLLSNECSVFLNNLSENDKNKLVSAKTISENLKKDAFVIESIGTINTMVKQATSESKSNYDYAMNILSNVQSIFSGVFAVASKNVKNDVESSYSMYKKAINDINEAHDKQIINSI